ncbi:MAG: TonB-dependent receptor plug domain-containing protein, partial [Acidimicrobiia bacterium]
MHALTALLTILLLLPVSAVAETWGSLEVTVHDPSGALLPDATVRVVEAGLEARSDRMGRALFDHLLPGRYTLLVVADHLEPVDSVRTSVTADALQRVSVSFVSVRSRATQVDVTGDDADLLRRIPGSADLLSARELADSHSIDANEVLRRIPGLTMREDSGPVGTRLNIGVRGLNPDRSRQVLILEDGLPLALAPYGEPEMYYSPPIERALRVEVLKGSGSILFGPQTIGGVVNFVTPDPPSRPRGALQLTGGQGGLFIAQGSYGTTAGRIGAFASALHKQGDGFRQFAFDINDLSTKLTFSLSPRQSLGVKFQWYEETSNSTYLGLTKPQFDA